MLEVHSSCLAEHTGISVHSLITDFCTIHVAVARLLVRLNADHNTATLSLDRHHTFVLISMPDEHKQSFPW